MRKYFLTLLVLVLSMTIVGTLRAQRITVTVAGTGSVKFDGDGKPGISTAVGGPFDVCIDAANNIYFTEQFSGLVRKLSSKNGLITRVAGGGTSTMDNIPATDAVLEPGNICLDAMGNLYVVSSLNQIRKIDAVTGIITTVSGTLAKGFYGDGGPATDAVFDGIWGICIDRSNNIYLVDTGNNRVRKITPRTGMITTIAGTGAMGYTGDGGPATDATLFKSGLICVNWSGDVFFADQGTGSSCIRKIDAVTGIISTIAGGGGVLFGVPALKAMLGSITGLCVDGSGNLFFNEISCSCRKMDMVTDSIYPVGGNFYIESFKNDTNSNGAWMQMPYGLCSDRSGNIFVADMANNRIRKLIQLTHVPSFAIGRSQSIATCSTYSFPLDIQLSVTDIDSAQIETWTMLSSPTHGVLAGFPYTMLSLGPNNLVMPKGLAYTSVAGYLGDDSFRIRVTDGVFADTVTVYVSISSPPSAGSIYTKIDTGICIGSSQPFYETESGGIWSMTNRDAEIDKTGIVLAHVTGLDTIVYSLTDYRCTVTTTFPMSVVGAPDLGIVSGVDSVCVGASIYLIDTPIGGTWSVFNSNAGISGTGIVTGFLPGVDTIFYSASNKCGIATVKKVMNIDTLLSAGVILGFDSVCVAATITLSDNILGGAWAVSNDNASITGLADVTGIVSGGDTVSYSLGNACGTTTTFKIIAVISTPDAGNIICDSVLCVGGKITLKATGLGGIWTQTNGHGMLSTGSFFGLSVGVDTIIYSVSNLCGLSYAVRQVTVNDCYPLSNVIPPARDITIFPNPVSSTLNIEWSNWAAQNIIVIADVTGREISRTEFNSSGAATAQLDVSKLTVGLYFVKINGTEIRKFVKE